MFDSNIFIDIEKHNSRAERFNFDVGGDFFVMDKVLHEITRKKKSKMFLGALTALPRVNARRITDVELEELRSLWLSARIKKDLDQFLNVRKADVHLLIWAWEKARREEKVTLVSNDKEIYLVSAKMKKYYTHADITIKKGSDLRINLH